MPARHQSPLHREVCRWFDPDSGAYLSHFGRVYLGGCRYVCVRAPLMSGFFSLNFFHHGRKGLAHLPAAGCRAEPCVFVGPGRAAIAGALASTPSTRMSITADGV